MEVALNDVFKKLTESLNTQESIQNIEKLMGYFNQAFAGDSLVFQGMQAEQVWYQLEEGIQAIVNENKHILEQEIDAVQETENNVESRSEEFEEEEELEDEIDQVDDGEMEIEEDKPVSKESFDEDEYNRYLDEMDEKEMEMEDQKSIDYDDAEGEEEDEEDENENEEDNKKEVDNDDDDQSAEDIFKTMAYGTQENNIERIEEKLIQKKVWQMKGEVRGVEREKNTLLEEDLEFQRGLQAKQKISKETNKNFEEIIRRRILDLAYDDREVFVSNKNAVNEQSKNLPELNFEKDKRGLIGAYEDQYKKDVMGVNEEKTKEEVLKNNIRDLFKTICFSIDNMTRFSFNPNTVSLKHETKKDDFVTDEKLPIVVSDNLVKPRESYKKVFNPKDKEFKSKAEMSREEKLRLRRRIKRTKKIKKDRIAEKERQKTGLSRADNKILERNASTIKKQIKDSKVQGHKMKKQSEFFKTMSKNKSSN